MAWSTDDEYCSRSNNVATTPEEASDTAMSGASNAGARDTGASDAGVILGGSYAGVQATGAIFIIYDKCGGG